MKKKATSHDALEAYRQTLPEYRRYEYYRFVYLQWDIVKAFYLIETEGIGIPIVLDVEQTVKALGLDAYDPPRHSISLIGMNPEGALREEVDTNRPILAAQVRLVKGEEADNMVLDGLHRIYKAHRIGQKEIQGFGLSPEEELLCRI